MNVTIGDVVVYRGNKATVKGMKSAGDVSLAIIEIYNRQPLMDLITHFEPTKKEIHTVNIVELKVIQSVWDNFYVLKVGNRTIPFTNKKDLLNAVTSKNFDKAEIFEVKKLGKPEIRVPLDKYGNTMSAEMYENDASMIPDDGGWGEW